MDKVLHNEGEFKIEVKDGDLYVELDSLGVDVMVKVESDYFLDKLAEAIPGELDDAVIGMIKAAMKA